MRLNGICVTDIHRRIGDYDVIAMSKLIDNDFLMQFCDESAPLDTPVRQKYCPFCEPDKITSHGFVVSRKRTGFMLWCHRCHTKRFIRTKCPSSTAILRDLRNRAAGANSSKAETLVQRKVTLPSDFTTDIPASGLLWLRTYGVNEDEIRKYRFGYSPSLDRLILPVFRGGELVFWQGRNLSSDKTKSKYLNVRSNRSDIVLSINQRTKIVVLVEDVLSALAVARAGVSAIALLGSYVNYSMIAPVLEELDIVGIKIWLDSDKRKESMKYSKALRALGYSCSSLVLPTKDPKEYTSGAIRTYLKIPEADV